jgi:hexosaminidase
LTTRTDQPALIPQPKAIDIRTGSRPLHDFILTYENISSADISAWLGYLQKQFNRLDTKLCISLLSSRADSILSLRKAGYLFLNLSVAEQADYTAEGYQLNLGEQGITIISDSHQGVVRGLQTLLQLIWWAFHKNEKRLPFLSIQDEPQFTWRGLHLDVSRHFFSVEEVCTFLDWMALLKLNRFHWHLTDDQGWRIESKKFPLLTEIGAWRLEPDGTPYGGFYSREAIKQVVSYAFNLGIEVIPEIDIPGHSQALLAAYPDFACYPKQFEVLTCWGISENILCAGKDEVLTFLKELFTETAELFPGRYFHLGGDEAPKVHWEACPLCQNRIKAKNLANEEELQSWLILELVEHLKKQGKTVVGWDEILDGNIDKEPVVMVWRGDGIDAAKKASATGNRYILSPQAYAYFDWRQTDKEGEAGAFGVTTLEKVYSFNQSEYAFDHPELLLGAQANVWTEHMPDLARVKYMILPRAWALAEALWCKSEQKDWADFQNRLDIIGDII